eukprot:COSAG04_NODE_238_length_19079_cov_9.187039_14_plen_237_part_00
MDISHLSAAAHHARTGAVGRLQRAAPRVVRVRAALRRLLPDEDRHADNRRRDSVERPQHIHCYGWREQDHRRGGGRVDIPLVPGDPHSFSIYLWFQSGPAPGIWTRYFPSWELGLQTMDDAAALAARLGKPIFLSEFGCIARANAYDQGIELASLYGMGWTLWELMVLTRESEPGTVSAVSSSLFVVLCTVGSLSRARPATDEPPQHPRHRAFHPHSSCLEFPWATSLLGPPTFFA